MKTQIIKIHIPKDMSTTITRDAYLHEKEIFEEVHDVECIIHSYGDVVELDTDEEYNRLLNTYGQNPDSGEYYVDIVYGRKGKGLKDVEDQIHYPDDIEVDAGDGLPDDDDIADVSKEPSAMTVPEIKAELDKYQIEYKKTWPAERLRELLISARMEEAA